MTVYVNSVLASLNFRSSEHTGDPAVPVGQRMTNTTIAQFSSLQFQASSTESAKNEDDHEERAARSLGPINEEADATHSEV